MGLVVLLMPDTEMQTNLRGALDEGVPDGSWKWD